MLAAKELGFSDRQIAHLTGTSEEVVRVPCARSSGVRPLVKTVDTCAGEFAARTSYHYFTYEDGGATERTEAEKPRVVILSAGPNRIGQGIEFDYCCVHAAYALEAKGYETVMVNCNPETVSTDYDTSDRLYFEPLTFEDVMNVIEVREARGRHRDAWRPDPHQPCRQAQGRGRPHHGHPAQEAIDLAEDRDRFASLLDRLEIAYPPSSTAETMEDATEVARRIGYPLLVRPSYVLGGRGMAIVYDHDDLRTYMAEGDARLARPPGLPRLLLGGRHRAGR